jgi:hypothetical protein
MELRECIVFYTKQSKIKIKFKSFSVSRVSEYTKKIGNKYLINECLNNTFNPKNTFIFNLDLLKSQPILVFEFEPIKIVYSSVHLAPKSQNWLNLSFGDLVVIIKKNIVANLFVKENFRRFEANEGKNFVIPIYFNFVLF